MSTTLATQLGRPLALHPDRTFPADPAQRAVARAIYAEVQHLPIISMHGHVDAAVFADNQPFADPAQLLIVPDHYVCRMLYSQGVRPEQMGIPRVDGGATETDSRAIWRRFCQAWPLFRGTPSRHWARPAGGLPPGRLGDPLLVTGVAFMPIVVAVSGGAGQLNMWGYAAAAAAMSVVGVLGFYACYRGTTEAVPVIRKPQEKITPATFAKTVFTNKALLTLILMTIFSISAYNIMPAMMAYFAQYDLANVQLLSVINFFSIGASIIAILCIPWLVKRLGKRNTALLGFAIAAVSAGINFLVPTNLYVFTVLYALTFIGVALPNGVTWAMVSDTIDYGDWRTGVRREGITYSMFNFSRKLA